MDVDRKVLPNLINICSSLGKKKKKPRYFPSSWVFLFHVDWLVQLHGMPNWRYNYIASLELTVVENKFDIGNMVMIGKPSKE